MLKSHRTGEKIKNFLRNSVIVEMQLMILFETSKENLILIRDFAKPVQKAIKFL